MHAAAANVHGRVRFSGAGAFEACREMVQLCSAVVAECFAPIRGN
jgi:hypothetical protein